MKNFKLETVKIRKIASLKIKLKLYSLIFKRNFNFIVKILISSFAIITLIFGWFLLKKEDNKINYNKLSSNYNNKKVNKADAIELVKEVFENKKETIVFNIIKQNKYKKYMYYTMIRNNSLKNNEIPKKS